MSRSIKGTETEKNLLKAFAGESQARNRYTYFASAAKKAGFEQIADIFLETAENEKEHAKIFFKFLEGGDVEITAAYPAGVIGDTAANLVCADGVSALSNWAIVSNAACANRTLTAALASGKPPAISYQASAPSHGA